MGDSKCCPLDFLRRGETVAYVYIVRCGDDTLYTGITKDIQKRMKTHLGGTATAAKYTRSHKVSELLSLWMCDDYKAAAKLEYAIKKKLTRTQKWELVANPDSLCEVFPHLSELQFTHLDGITLEDCVEGKVKSKIEEK